MATTTIDVKELPAHFLEMVSQAAAGTDVIVTEGNIPRARLVPLAPAAVRLPGLHAGAIHMADDFDAPLPEEFWTSMPPAADRLRGSGGGSS